MSEHNVEEKEILEEQNEEAVEMSVVEEPVEEPVKEEGSKGKASFAKRLGAVIVDEAIMGIISVALLYIFEAALTAAGFTIAQKGSMLLIIFVIVSILYTSIGETAGEGKTIGKKMLGI